MALVFVQKKKLEIINYFFASALKFINITNWFNIINIIIHSVLDTTLISAYVTGILIHWSRLSFSALKIYFTRQGTVAFLQKLKLVWRALK